MSRVDQSLAGFISHSETVLMGIDLSLGGKKTFGSVHGFFQRKLLRGRRRRYLVFLMAIQQSLRSSHVIGQFVGIDQRLHLRHPAGQIPEVGGEALQPVNRGQR